VLQEAGAQSAHCPQGSLLVGMCQSGETVHQRNEEISRFVRGRFSDKVVLFESLRQKLITIRQDASAFFQALW